MKSWDWGEEERVPCSLIFPRQLYILSLFALAYVRGRSALQNGF